MELYRNSSLFQILRDPVMREGAPFCEYRGPRRLAAPRLAPGHYLAGSRCRTGGRLEAVAELAKRWRDQAEPAR